MDLLCSSLNWITNRSLNPRSIVFLILKYLHLFKTNKPLVVFVYRSADCTCPIAMNFAFGHCDSIGVIAMDDVLAMVEWPIISSAADFECPWCTGIDDAAEGEWMVAAVDEVETLMRFAGVVLHSENAIAGTDLNYYYYGDSDSSKNYQINS